MFYFSTMWVVLNRKTHTTNQTYRGLPSFWARFKFYVFNIRRHIFTWFHEISNHMMRIFHIILSETFHVIALCIGLHSLNIFYMSKSTNWTGRQVQKQLLRVISHLTPFNAKLCVFELYVNSKWKNSQEFHFGYFQLYNISGYHNFNLTTILPRPL